MPSLRTIAAALAALGLGAVLLAACSGSKEATLNCPRVVQAPGADKIALFGPNGHAVKDVIVGGKIYDLTYRCQPEKVGFAVMTEITFWAERADPAITDTSFPYFVALVDPYEHVLEEQGFKINIPFIPGESFRRMLPEKISVHLPLKDTATGSAYTVVVGFQLTPEQIAFNRAAVPQ